MITVTGYKKNYYTDIMHSGYPFNTYLEPDFSSQVRNLFNLKEIEKFILKSIFLNQEEINLAAYSEEEKKAVGVVTLRKITANLWGIWNIFVSPSHRGKRIASLLYDESFNFLRGRSVKKATGTVALSNIPSLKSIERNWQGFLPRRIFTSMITGQISEQGLDKITTRKPYFEDGRELYRIFKKCVGHEWCTFLEINHYNYLDRIFGFGYFEPIDKSLLTRIAVKTDISVAEYKGELQGYAILRTVRLFRIYSALHMFVPVTDEFDRVCRALLLRVFSLPTFKRRELNSVFVGTTSVRDRIINLGFEVAQRLVPYRHL